MGIQLGRRCPRLLSQVNGRPHAGDQDHEPEVVEERKMMMEAEVNQSPQSSICDGSDSGKEDEMSPDTERQSKLPIYAADIPPSSLSIGSTPKDSEAVFDSWETPSRRRHSKNLYSAKTNDASRLAQRKTAGGGGDNIHAPDRQQGNKRKRSPSISTQGGFKTPKAFHLPKEEALIPVTEFQAPPMFAINNADDGSTGTSPASKEFQLPSSVEALGLTSVTPLSSPPLPPTEIENDVPGIDSERPLEAQCPMCGASVQQEDLDDFELQHPGMEFRSQQLFCRMHKKRESEEEWKQRGYPDIDWEHLPYRLRNYRPVIYEILTKPKVSHFRGDMAERLRRGKDRNLMMHVHHEGLQSCSVGYYGPRGLKIMTDFILAEFSDDIRRLAGSDKVIAARGATGYVQMVLAPELATKLVMDDMRQSHPNMKVEEAREILGSSSDLGYLLNGLEDVEQQVITSESQQIVVEDGLEDL